MTVAALAAALYVAVSPFAPSIGAQVPTIADSAAAATIRELTRTNPELAARRSAVTAAEARVAAAGFLPPAQFEAEVEEVPNGVNLLEAGSLRVGISRQYSAGAGRRAEREVARRELERTRLELELMERSLLARADQLLVESASALLIGRRLSAEDSLFASAEEALRTRFSVGEARYVEVLRLRSERLRVQNERLQATADARVARRALLAIVGTADSATRVVDAAIATQLSRVTFGALPTAPSVDSLVAVAGAVRLASADVTTAEAERTLVRARQRTAYTAFGGIQRFDRDDGKFTVGPVLGFSMTLPGTARRANEAQLAVADRDVAAAQAERRAAMAHVRAELAAAVERYDAARTSLSLFDTTLLRAAREERESALSAYRSGEISLLELLDFERSLARAEIDRLRSQMEAADALADLVAGVAGIGEDTHGQITERRSGGDR